MFHLSKWVSSVGFGFFYIILQLIEESLLSRLIPKSPVLEQFYIFILQILLAKVMNYFAES